MKAQELRIANYFKPDALDEPAFRTITAKDIVELNDDPLDDYYQPIQLTEEWLLKFGFKQTFISKNHLTFRKGSVHLFKRVNNIQIWYENIDVKYVHQLQNLYFALTNQELTI